MATSHRFVVVSGIPGCGKSTLGRALAQRLDTPFFDKDDILEALFDGLGCRDGEARQRLSRAADRVFESVARSCSKAILTSLWRHPSADATSGTPSGWLRDSNIRTVEVFCRCLPELAAKRFLERSRHEGHCDSAWSHATLVARARELATVLPLGVGTTIEVDTTDSIDTDMLAERVRTALEA